MSRVDVIANERLLDDRHHWHELQDYWTDGPVALVFLRQFGSAFALEQARAISKHYEEIIEAGGNVVFIGLGTSIHGFTFRKRSGSRFPVLITHDRTLYRTMGLQRIRTVGQVVGSVLPFIRTVRAGNYPYQPTGDNDLLGGVFIVPAGGKSVAWEFRARRPSDVVPVRVVVDELAKAAALVSQ